MIFKNLIKWTLGIFFIFLGGIFLIPPINDFIKSKWGHLKIIAITNDWGRFLIVLILSSFILNNTNPQPQTQQANNQNNIESAAMTTSEKNIRSNNENIKKLAKAINIKDSKASEIYKILSDCGVKDITYIEKMDGNDVRGYFVHVSNANNPVRLGILANDKVDMVIYDSWILYEEGAQKDNLNNYAISSDDMHSLKLASMQKVREYLIHPETAKFNSDWTGTKLDNEFNLSSKVKYKNDLGAEHESPFTAQFKKENGALKITFLSIDDEICIKKVTPQKQLSKKDKEDVKELERLMGM